MSIRHNPIGQKCKCMISSGFRRLPILWYLFRRDLMSFRATATKTLRTMKI